YVLRGYALPWIERLLPSLRQVLAQSPFRQMVTPRRFYDVGKPALSHKIRIVRRTSTKLS
ncbi:hypothetical protein ACQXYO_11850, partial [Corynebacterium diphtheriae]